tara:strand:- start:1396 stop:2364 length:969 start_codon:yes stop_codon:yes gene_type:complete
MKKLKYLLGIIVIVGLFLISAPSVRHYLLSGFVKIPSLISTMRYQSHLEMRNFKSVVGVLRSEYELISKFSSNDNRFLLHFVENLTDTYMLTELSSEKQHYRLLVNDLLNKYPSILPIYDIKSNIMLNNNEDIGELITQLDLEEISSRSIYMRGVINDVMQNKSFSNWCEKYLEESLTDVSIPYSRPMLSMQNGNIALIVNDKDAERISWSTMPELGNSILRLSFDSSVEAQNISIVITTQLGSKVEIKKISLLKNGKKSIVNNFISSSEEAAFIDKNTFIALDINTKIDFMFKETNVFDSIELNISINPRAPSSLDLCNIY